MEAHQQFAKSQTARDGESVVPLLVRGGGLRPLEDSEDSSGKRVNLASRKQNRQRDITEYFSPDSPAHPHQNFVPLTLLGRVGAA